MRLSCMSSCSSWGKTRPDPAVRILMGSCMKRALRTLKRKILPGWHLQPAQGNMCTWGQCWATQIQIKEMQRTISNLLEGQTSQCFASRCTKRELIKLHVSLSGNAGYWTNDHIFNIDAQWVVLLSGSTIACTKLSRIGPEYKSALALPLKFGKRGSAG